jgi:hypothetical protein
MVKNKNRKQAQEVEFASDIDAVSTQAANTKKTRAADKSK